MQNEAYMFIIKNVKSKIVSNSIFFIWVKIFHKILVFYLSKGTRADILGYVFLERSCH